MSLLLNHLFTTTIVTSGQYSKEIGISSSEQKEDMIFTKDDWDDWDDDDNDDNGINTTDGFYYMSTLENMPSPTMGLRPS